MAGEAEVTALPLDTAVDPERHERDLADYRDCQKKRELEALLGSIYGGAGCAKQRMINVNGRRRTRILTWGDVIDILREASEKGYAWADLPTVANSYGYPSYRTLCLAAKRSDGTIRVEFAVGRASRGSSPISQIVGHVTVNTKHEKMLGLMRMWADSLVPIGPPDDPEEPETRLVQTQPNPASQLAAAWMRHRCNEEPLFHMFIGGQQEQGGQSDENERR